MGAVNLDNDEEACKEEKGVPLDCLEQIAD